MDRRTFIRSTAVLGGAAAAWRWGSAGSLGAPYIPTRSLLGTELVESNPRLLRAADPWTGAPLVLVPALVQPASELAWALAIAAVKAAAILAVVLWLGQKLMRPWFNVVARRRSHELFIINVLFITLGLAYVTEAAGLSLGLGAFIAGMLIHLMRVFCTGAFRKPRELTFGVGITMLVLGMLEGFVGYSLPDDLLSGTGLRIADGLIRATPVVGTYASILLFGGEFPGPDVLNRLLVLHIFIIPLALFVARVDRLVRLLHQRYAVTDKGRGLLVEDGRLIAFRVPRTISTAARGDQEFGDIELGLVLTDDPDEPMRNLAFQAVSYPLAVIDSLRAVGG